MNETTQYKLPLTGSGKLGKREFEWSIVENWVCVRFPGAFGEGSIDLEVEGVLAPNGYFDMNSDTQTWWKTWEAGEEQIDDSYSFYLSDILPFFTERYAQ